MALPILTVSKHELILPSSGEKISFRPFLVKEEKILMTAMQSGDPADMVGGLRQIISNCLDSDIDIDKLPTFDVEYIFLQLRAKSVGDNIDIEYEGQDDCEIDKQKCRFKTAVNIDDIKVEKQKGHKDIVDITDQIKVKLRYPQIEMSSQMGNVEGQDMIDLTFKMLASCIEYIMDGVEMHKTEDYSEKEVDAFLNSLSSAQFKKMQSFFDTMPKLKKDIESQCVKCQKKEKRTLEGLADFFV